MAFYTCKITLILVVDTRYFRNLQFSSLQPVVVLLMYTMFFSQHVRVRLHRPRDSLALGLSQIQILGTTLYGPLVEVPPGGAMGTRRARWDFCC